MPRSGFPPDARLRAAPLAADHQECDEDQDDERLGEHVQDRARSGAQHGTDHAAGNLCEGSRVPYLHLRREVFRQRGPQPLDELAELTEIAARVGAQLRDRRGDDAGDNQEREAAQPQGREQSQ